MIAASFSLVQEATQYDGEDFGILAMFPKMFRKSPLHPFPLSFCC